MTPAEAAEALEMRLMRLNIAATVKPIANHIGGGIVLLVTCQGVPRGVWSSSPLVSDWLGYPVRLRVET